MLTQPRVQFHKPISRTNTLLIDQDDEVPEVQNERKDIELTNSIFTPINKMEKLFSNNVKLGNQP